jgi:DNA modification methylase
MNANPKLEHVHPANLVPHSRNAKLHNRAQVEQIADSIRQFGFLAPVLVDQDNGILAGHARTIAALKLGIDQIPVIRLSHLSEIQRRAYILADNKLAETGGGWNEDLLKIELAAIEESDLDALITGFSSDELADLIDTGTDETGTDPDATPEAPTQPETEPGDLWILGEHRLLCGDSTRREDVIKVMNGRKADMVFTDPPYGANVKGSKTGFIEGDLTQTAIPFAFELAVTVASATNARLYFCGAEANIALYSKLFDRFLQQIPRHLIWMKESFIMKQNGYHNQYEIIFHGFKAGGGGKETWHGPRTGDYASDVWQIKRDNGADYVHPTQKPVALPARALTNHSKKHDLIFEPFGGSGSTLIAAEQLHRVCYSIELSPHYCDVIKTRWENFTGKKATRAEK